MKPLVWSSRLALCGAGLVFAWLASIELGSSRSASRAAAADGNEGETVVDTTTSRLFDAAATAHLVVGAGASVLLPATTIRSRVAAYAAGLALLVGSGLLSARARHHLGRFHRDDLTIHDDQLLVDTGPYRRVRHPLYVATAGALIGTGAVLGSWVSLCSAALPTAALAHRITVEEQMLVGHLGARYTAYQGRTSRLLPGIW